MKTKPDYTEYIAEYNQKLRRTKVKGKRLFYILQLEYMKAATAEQLTELKKLKKEISDWELEADYYCEMDRKQEERQFRKLITTSQ